MAARAPQTEEDLVVSLIRVVGAAAVTGLLAAGFAIAFRVAVARGLDALLGTDDILAGFGALPLMARLVLPAIGGFIAGLIGIVAVQGSGHALADVMEAVTLGRGAISLRLTFAKSLASYAALVSGASLGREGSILQAGAALGEHVGRRMRLPARERRALLAAGTAAGFAAAYNTPIAAVVFVIEVITGVIELETLLPVIIATTAATAATRAVIGGVPLYGKRSFALASPAELAAHASVGVLAGLLGPVFLALLFEAESRVRRSGVRRPIAAAAGGLVVGVLAMGFPQVAGNGFEAIQNTLDGNLAGPLLLALVLGKGVATIASVSTGSPGGVFTPSMFMGAALGGTIGTIAPSIFPAAGPSGGYALVGMAAMVAATTHAPLMAATLAFELSGDYAIVLPLLLATSIAAFVSRSLREDSVYTEELRRRGIPWHGSLRQRLASAVRARDILERSVAVVLADAPLDEALRRFDEGARAVYLSGTPARVIGTETARSIWAARARGQAVPLTCGEAGLPVDVATLDDTLLALSEKLWKQEQGQLPVVDAKGEIVGVVTRREVLGAIDREVLDRSALLTRVVRYEGPRASADYLELPVGWLVETVGVPAALVDQVIDFGALREDPGVVVLGVRPRGRGALFDVAGRRLRPGDHLVIVGPLAAIEAFVAPSVAA